MSPKKSNLVQRFVQWLFGSPFRELPSEFGNPVPPELRAFEAEAEEIQRHPFGKVPASSSPRSGQSR
jgi:hypothetical protein